jgi:tetratricopeptide (TPR) repeat protein
MGMGVMPTTVTVNVREANGMPLEGHAFVRLFSNFQRYNVTAPTQENSTATFTSVGAGDYEVEVSCAGYKTANERITIHGEGPNTTLFIYLHPEGEETTRAKPPMVTTMTPKLQSELDKGFDKMKKQQYEAAREHFEKASKLAPGNPDMVYMLGMIDYKQGHFDLARAKFEKALAMYPGHERSLLGLGEIRLRSGDAAGAAETLEKAFQANGADWRAQFLLAQAYHDQKQYEKAAARAKRAAELAKDQAAPPLLLLGRIYAADKKTEAAKQTFELLMKEFPKDQTAGMAKWEIAALEAKGPAERSQLTAAASSKTDEARINEATTPGVPTSLPLLREVVERPWAPADVDSKEYPLAPNVACQQGEVLAKAQERVLHQMQNFEKFMATEHIEHRQVDRQGNEGDIRTKDFSYLVFVRPFRKDSFFLEESRDGGVGVDSFPTSLVTTGLVGLGVAILEREYEGDFEYKCEGLSSWRGQAAWQMRFEQKRNVESRVRVWRRRGELFPVALKGRIWLAANSYDLLHMESDLRDPIEKLVLTRDHLAIDYGPVSFETGNQKLWLPWKAEMFMELRGKRYHHQHMLSDYMLFSVDTTNKIGKPKLPPEEDSKPQE